MRNPAEVYLKRAIVHVLNSEDENGLVTSDLELTLEPGGRVVSYIQKHILKGLRDSAATAGRFRSLDKDKPSDICQRILTDLDAFVDGSQQLASRLFQCMRDDKRTSAGDLIVAIYTTGADPAAESYLALLKIDPSGALRHRIESTTAGTRVSIDEDEDILQTTGERLQKCAFVQTLEPRADYDMMVLDRQTRGTKAVAEFFLDSYLDAEPTLDAKQRTEKLYTALLDAHNTIRPDVAYETNVSIDAIIQGTLRSKSVSVPSVLEALPVTTEQRAIFEDKINQQLPDQEFVLDPTVATKLTKKRYRGAQGVKFEVEEDSYNEVVRSEQFNEQGQFTELVLRVRAWREVKR